MHVSLLLKQLERALLRLVARLYKTAQRLLARRVLLAAHNAPLLGLHQVVLLEAATGVLRRSMVDLSLGADREHGTAVHIHVHVSAALATLHVHVLAALAALATLHVHVLATLAALVTLHVHVLAHVVLATVHVLAHVVLAAVHVLAALATLHVHVLTHVLLATLHVHVLTHFLLTALHIIAANSIETFHSYILINSILFWSVMESLGIRPA